MPKIIVSDSPHIKGPRTTKGIMADVIIALIPAFIAGMVFFGLKAFMVTAVSVAACTATEIIYSLFQKKDIKKILKDFDFTSVITGLLLAFSLPAGVPFYVPLISSVFSIAVVKMLFGGTGKNIVNPAIAGRIFAFIAFQGEVSSFTQPAFSQIAAASLQSGSTVTGGATVLTDILAGAGAALSNLDLFLGSGVMGCIGETSKLAILIGGGYLVIKRVIDWKWPVVYIAFTGLTAVLLQGLDWAAFLPNILSGGLFLGAVFMATDYVTSPTSDNARWVYYPALGMLTAVLRQATGLETVSFSILLLNLIVPLINSTFRPRIFGAPTKWQRLKKKLKEKKGGAV